ncbi:uncharacterized protein METZ01_LOCUS298823, partial [marine metagenome]
SATFLAGSTSRTQHLRRDSSDMQHPIKPGSIAELLYSSR